MPSSKLEKIMSTNIGTTPYTVALTPPDISAYKNGNTGVDYISTFDSGIEGPHVMINAITHGNELCGALVLDRLFKMQLRPSRGKLSLSFANVAAFHAFDPASPNDSRYVDEDFNRVWSAEVLDGSRQSSELARARTMRPIIDSVDFLLDHHSMHDPHLPLTISGTLPRSIALAKDLCVPEHIVVDGGHANGTRMRDYEGFSDPTSHKTALLTECGQHWQPDSETLAWQITWRFLARLNMVDRDLAKAHIDPASTPTQKVVRVTQAVTATGEHFIFSEGLRGFSILPNKGDVIALDEGVPVLAPYDNCVLIMPTLIHVKPGLTAVRLGQLELLP
jgi:predicted deacylase